MLICKKLCGGKIMNKQKRLFSIAAAVFSFLAGATFLCKGASVAASAEQAVSGTEEIAESSEDISTRGIYTSLSLSINGGDGRVWATVRNDITIFPATVMVIVELYSSDEYEENHENMTIVSRVATMV